MRRNGLILLAALTACVGLAWALAAAFTAPPPGARVVPEPEVRAASDAPAPEAPDEDALARAALEAMLDRDYPLHGLVTATQIPVRVAADRDSQVIGWLRLGGHVRARREPVEAPRCASGFYALYPRGFACAGQGVDFAEAPPERDDAAARRDAPLPYRYLLVTQPQTPEYHQIPSREQQREATEHGARYAALLTEGRERQATKLREGRLANEPRRPAIVARYLQRNFYVASNGGETRAQRRFARTVRGSWVREAELEERTGSEFAGVALDEERTLPIAWAVRASRPMRRVVHPDDTVHIRPIPDARGWERLEVVPWLRRENVGGRDYHVLDLGGGEEGYVRRWFVSVAERIEPPAGVREDEPWVHVDVSEQTLVLYRGPTPRYATLVSTGVDGHDTPRGEFRIHRKYVSDTMANLGPEAGDDSYRIDDVPWTQYFAGSVALHGAFWHHRFGLPRSHGCVNLSPRDAQHVFRHTWPDIPLGWHGVSTDRGTGFVGSRVLVTD
ncbi:MAG: L,D-transpeptidase [Sandaracinaceae bacterium]|nr:L,D-transpeptidase [Sandaracinaceae bacterium]